MRTSLLTLVVLAASAVGLTAPHAASQTITEIVLQSGTPGEFDSNPKDFDILLQAVVTAGLDDDLDAADAGLTVFAPTDQGFIRLAQDLGYVGDDEAEVWDFLVGALDGLSGGDPVGLLTSVLQYHVVAQEVSVFEFFLLSLFGQSVDTLLPGATFTPRFIAVLDNEPDLTNPRLTFPLNLVADNGIVHAINRVMIPIDLP